VKPQKKKKYSLAIIADTYTDQAKFYLDSSIVDKIFSKYEKDGNYITDYAKLEEIDFVSDDLDKVVKLYDRIYNIIKGVKLFDILSSSGNWADFAESAKYPVSGSILVYDVFNGTPLRGNSHCDIWAANPDVQPMLLVKCQIDLDSNKGLYLISSRV